MEQLKELLGELYDQVVAKVGDKKLIVDDGTLIPQYRWNETKKRHEEEIGQLKAVIAKNENDLKELKQAAAGNEGLTKQINELQKNNREASEEFIRKELVSRKAFAVKEALLNAGVIDETARATLARTFDMEKIELDEQGKPKNFTELLKPLKENQAFSSMFMNIALRGQEHNAGLPPDPTLGEYATKNPFSKEFRNLALQVQIKRERPELAKKLEAAALA